jgi:hypothetical protein
MFLRMANVLGVPADMLLGRNAGPTTMPASFPFTSPDDPPEIRCLVAVLHKAPPSTVRLVRTNLNEFEPLATSRRRARSTGKPASGTSATSESRTSTARRHP